MPSCSPRGRGRCVLLGRVDANELSRVKRASPDRMCSVSSCSFWQQLGADILLASSRWDSIHSVSGRSVYGSFPRGLSPGTSLVSNTERFTMFHHCANHLGLGHWTPDPPLKPSHHSRPHGTQCLPPPPWALRRVSHPNSLRASAGAPPRLKGP